MIKGKSALVRNVNGAIVTSNGNLPIFYLTGFTSELTISVRCVIVIEMHLLLVVCSYGVTIGLLYIK